MQKIFLTAARSLLEHPAIVQEIVFHQSSRSAHRWSSLTRNRNQLPIETRLIRNTRRILHNAAKAKKNIEEEVILEKDIPSSSPPPPLSPSSSPQQIITTVAKAAKSKSKVPDPLSASKSSVEIPTLDLDSKSLNRLKASSLLGGVNVASTNTTAIDEVIQVKPIKLMNTIDPTVLTNLYKSEESLNSIYLSLSKSRLTSFVVITAMAGYTLSSATLVSPDLVWISIGTFLTSASANTINQIIERDYDGLMDRTKNRVLVKKLITPQHAAMFGALSGIGGMACLYSVNELCAVIGLANLVLYTCAYTPLKRKHIINTWVGSVVGALPPLIGYAGAVNYIDAKALVLSAIMFAWQFPHFNALSWNLRNEYDRAGYKMMCFANERLCRVTSLRYSLFLTAVCAASPLVEAAEWSFVIDSGIINAYLCYLSWQFYKNADAKTSRKLFRYTLIHLPLLILFLILSKKSNTTQKEVVLKSVN